MINSNIILSKGIRIDKAYTNVLSYNESQMLQLLRSPEHLIYESNNYSFIDEFQNIICVQVPIGDCLALNYMAFQNPRYNNKWFFCFIDKVEYNSERSTNITFHIDSWSTWFDSLEQEQCYTIREHVRNDTIGANLTDENLAVETECLSASTQEITSNIWVCVATNYIPGNSQGEGQDYSSISVYNDNIFRNSIVIF